MTPLSVEYCRRVRVHLAAVGSPFASGAGAPSAGLPVVINVPGLAARSAVDAAAAATLQAPLRRPSGEVRAASSVKVPRANTRKLALAQDREKARSLKRRQMWAAHEARMRSIYAKLRPDSLRISTGI